MGLATSRLRALFSLLLILVFSARVQDANGFLCLPMFRKGTGSLRLLFATPSYYVYRATWCASYIHKATNDDIVKNMYIFIDLFSTKHHKAIIAVNQEDDPHNNRTNIVSYEIDPQFLPPIYENATLGAVWYFNQRLDKQKDYANRTLITYKDDLGRYCVLIQSFDASGNRVSMKIYRKRKRVWWLKKVADEGATVAESFLNFAWGMLKKPKPVDKQVLNIADSNCPLGLVNHKTSFYDIIYNKSPGKDVETIGEIIFRTMPETITEGTTDLFVWRYFKPGERDNITYVVIAEIFFDYANIKYYRCISAKERHYELIDSFAARGDSPVTTEASNSAVSWQNPKVDLVMDYQKNFETPYEVGLNIVAYPHSNHYVIRPISGYELKFFKSLKITGPYNTVALEKQEDEGFALVSISDVRDRQYKWVSLTYIGSRGFDVSGDVLFLDPSIQHHQRRLRSSADQHANFTFKHLMPIYYMVLPLDVLTTSNESVVFQLDSYQESEVLAAQYDSVSSFYTPNLYQTTHFKRCVFNNYAALNLGKSYNTQVMYMELGETNVAILFQAGLKEVLLYEIGPKSIRPCDNMKKLEILTKHKLLDYEQMTKNIVKKEVENLVLNLNDSMLNRGIEPIVISSNVVMFKPASSGIRISAVIWGYDQLSLRPNSNSTVTVITNNHQSFLLIDEIFHNMYNINRHLYVMEPKPTPKLRIVANHICDLSSYAVDKVRSCLDDSWYSLIPEKLPILTDFEDQRIGTALFPYHDLSIAYLPYWHEFTLGSTRVGSFQVETMEGHRWRQVHKQRVESDTKGIIYTMTPSGITQQTQIINGEGYEETITPFERFRYPVPEATHVTLLVDNIAYSDAHAMVSKIGGVTLTTLKPRDASKTFNPVVFGHHEIHLAPGYKCNKVILSIGANEKREINFDVINPEGSDVMMTFTQEAKGSDHYQLHAKDKGVIAFVDVNKNLYAYEKNFQHLFQMDFNIGIFPHYVRYLTLNDHTMYFTGFAPADGLNVVFGHHQVTLPESGFSFHIWIKYPHKTSDTGSIYLSYHADGKKISDFYTVEDIQIARSLKRPGKNNCNWGPMSNVEFHMVSEIVSRRYTLRGELDVVKLDLSSGKRDPSILKLSVDSTTSLYTTLASSGSVIGRIDYKGVVIEGMDRQVVKHVYHSQGHAEDIVLVVTRTFSNVFVKAYRFGHGDVFESVDYSTVDPKAHRSVHNVLKQFA